MDIAYYLTELLAELGEVNVPGLGSFTQQKVDGYYDDTEGKFYPPAADVHYEKHFVDDDVLAAYIADKKKISLASSKYFIEKYSSKVSVEVMMEDVQIAGLGWIYPIGDGLAFRKTNAPINDPVYYGYPQIALQKLKGTSFPDQPEAETAVAKDEDKHSTAATGKMPVAEPEVNTTTLDEHPEQPDLAHEPVIETEAAATTHEEPATGPETVGGDGEHLNKAATADTFVGDPGDMIVPEAEPFERKEEPVAPVDFGASMEDYLRDLEGGAYIAGPETTELQAQPEPVTEAPEVAAEQEVISPEQEPDYEAVAELPEPARQPPVDVPFPEHIPETYTPDAELQQYILDKAPVAPQPEPYEPPVVGMPAKTAQDEEEFIFDGKGYDDVDNLGGRKRSYLWLWVTFGVLVLLAGAAAFVYYQHEQKIKMMRAAEAVPKPVINKDTVKKAVPADSLKDTTHVIKDTTQKRVMSATGVNPVSSAAANSVPAKSAPATSAPATGATPSAIDSSKARYELIGTKCRTIAEANLRVRNYKSLNIPDAHIVTGPIFGRLIKVSLGTYQNRSDAINRRQEIYKTGKVRSIDLEKVNPKK